MEFANRKACIDHYEGQFPNLPRYMIEMALDYDLQHGGHTSEKPKTNKQKREFRRAQKELDVAPVKREINETIKDALANAKPLEVDAVRVVRAEDYVMPPMMKGAINVDGALFQSKLEPEPQVEEVEEVAYEMERKFTLTDEF